MLLSIGGANTAVELNSEADKQNFINSVANIVTLYGLNGVDIDFEGSSLSLNAGDLDFRSPTTPKVVNLISATAHVEVTLRQRFHSVDGVRKRSTCKWASRPTVARLAPISR